MMITESAHLTTQHLIYSRGPGIMSTNIVNTLQNPVNLI